jgi:hypothetical protein
MVKIAMDYYNKLTKHFSEKYNLDKEDFSKYLANTHGYNSFDEMSDDEKHAAFTDYMAHLKNI